MKKQIFFGEFRLTLAFIRILGIIKVMKEYILKTFTHLEHAADFLNGKLLFRNIVYFQDIEEDGIRGDSQDGTMVEIINAVISPNVKHFTIDGGKKKYIVDWENAKKALSIPDRPLAQFRLTYVVDYLVFCMTYISEKTKDRDKVINYAQTFGKFSVVISDVFDFCNKLFKHLPAAKMDFVKYDDNLDLNPFIKRKKYKLQNELRILTERNAEETKIIDLKPLKGFICDTSLLSHYLN